VGEVLVKHYGRNDAVVQIMEMVRMSVDRGIKQLMTGAAPEQNARPFTPDQPNRYVMPAREHIDAPDGNMQPPEPQDPNRPLQTRDGLILPPEGEDDARPSSGHGDDPVPQKWVL
jgi:hypothetical protein